MERDLRTAVQSACGGGADLKQLKRETVYSGSWFRVQSVVTEKAWGQEPEVAAQSGSREQTG